ncbi:MAG: Hpt domain-containing protein [Treponema sp.]|nr:Hpt domain-containing protein [Treponema sp.]
MSKIPEIPGVDTEQGVTMTGGTIEGYCRVLSMFRRDAEGRLRMLRFFLFADGNMGTEFPEKHISSLLTQVQALKSASATLGAMGLYTQAADLESAAKNKELALVQKNLLIFIENLAELSKNIRIALEKLESMESENDEKETLNTDYLNDLINALKSKNASEIEFFLNDFDRKNLDSKFKELLEKVSDQVLMTEFDSAVKTIEDFLNANK